MPFLQETPRSLATYFVLAGFLSTASSIAGAVHLKGLGDAAGGLNILGYAILAILCLLAISSAIIFFSGIFFRKVAINLPYLVPGALGVTLCLNAISLLLNQAQWFVPLASCLITAYLIVQYTRISKELRQPTAEPQSATDEFSAEIPAEKTISST